MIADFRFSIFDCELRIMDCGKVIRSIALMLPLALVVGTQAAGAQSHSRHDAHANEKWAQQWRKEWLAKHGGNKPANAMPSANKTMPSVPASQRPTSPITPMSPQPSAPAVTNVAPLSAQMPAAATYAPIPAPSATSGVKPISSAGTSTGNAASSAPVSAIENPKSKVQNPNVLSQTKPDFITPGDPVVGNGTTGDHTRDNPMSSVGDTWKMIVFLVPVLLGIVGFLHLLKRFQARTGRLPGTFPTAGRNGSGATQQRKPSASSGIWNALLGGFHLNNARQSAGSSLRLLESMPIGGANVHLLEVRGRVLLLGSSPAGLNLLTEFDERGSAASEDFRDLLHAAAADMDAMDYEQDDLPATATVSTLEELMREAGQSVAKNARRLRDVEIND